MTGGRCAAGWQAAACSAARRCLSLRAAAGSVHAHSLPVRFTIVRPYNWIGPRMDYIPGVDGKDDGQPRVLASFMTALMKGEPLVLVNGGEVPCGTPPWIAADPPRRALNALLDVRG